MWAGGRKSGASVTRNCARQQSFEARIRVILTFARKPKCGRVRRSWPQSARDHIAFLTIIGSGKLRRSAERSLLCTLGAASNPIGRLLEGTGASPPDAPRSLVDGAIVEGRLLSLVGTRFPRLVVARLSMLCSLLRCAMPPEAGFLAPAASMSVLPEPQAAMLAPLSGQSDPRSTS